MSLQKVGLEILPNVYIKNIEVFDDSETHYAIRVKTCVLDYISPNNSGRWSTSPMAENLSILFVASAADSINLNISRGDIDFNYSFMKPYSNNPDVHVMTKKVFTNKSYISRPFTYYNNYFDFTIQKNQTGLLKLFCSVFYNDPSSKKAYRGPVTSESIFDNNNNILPDTTIFLTKDKVQHFGPVHEHDNKYMAGSYHTSESHPTLVQKKITNYKIKDYRKPKYKRRSAPQQKDSHHIISDLFVSHNDGKNISAIFSLNIRDLIFKETKYGHLLESLNPNVVNDMLANTSIKSFSIVRSRTKPVFEINNAGTKKTTSYNEYDLKVICSSKDSGGGLVSKRRLIGIKPSSHEISYNSDEVGNEPRPGQLLRQKPLKQKPVSYIKETDIISNAHIRYYEFSDLEINSDSPGSYKYKVRLILDDPTIKYVSDLNEEIRLAEIQLKEYYNRMTRKKNYIYEMDMPHPDFIGLNSPKTENSVKNTSIRAYLKMVEILFDLTDEEKDSLIRSISAKINPSCATLNSVNNFIFDFDLMKSNFIKYFDYKLNRTRTHGLKTSPSRVHHTTNIIIKEYGFKQVITPSDYKDVYKILDFQETSTGLPRASISYYNSRVSQEQNKYYNKSNNTKKQTNNLTPKAIINHKEEINVNSDSTETYEKINKFFSNRMIKIDNKISNSQGKYLDIVENNLFVEEADLHDALIPLVEEQQVENFINSDEYLGQAVDYTDIENEYKMAENQSKKDFFSKVVDSINFSKTTSLNKKSFDISSPDSILSTVKANMPKDQFKKYMSALPASLRSLFESKKKEVRNNYLTSEKDVFENHNTQNIANIRHFKILTIEQFVGFKRDNDNNYNMARPLYLPLTEDLIEMPGIKLCRMTWFSNSVLKIKSDHLTMPISNSHFILYPDTNEPYDATTSSRNRPYVDHLSQMIMRYDIGTMNYDMDASTNNIIIQFKNDFSSTIIPNYSPAVIEQPSPPGSKPSLATDSISTSVSSPSPSTSAGGSMDSGGTY